MYLQSGRSVLKPELLRGLDPAISSNGGDGRVIATIEEVEIQKRLILHSRTFHSADLQVVVSESVDNMSSGGIELRKRVLHPHNMRHHAFPRQSRFLVVIPQHRRPRDTG